MRYRVVMVSDHRCDQPVELYYIVEQSMLGLFWKSDGQRFQCHQNAIDYIGELIKGCASVRQVRLPYHESYSKLSDTR